MQPQIPYTRYSHIKAASGCAKEKGVVLEVFIQLNSVSSWALKRQEPILKKDVNFHLYDLFNRTQENESPGLITFVTFDIRDSVFVSSSYKLEEKYLHCNSFKNQKNP